jgi:hypothetical protein
MRSIFAIWLDDGRVDYGITRPRLTGAGRLVVAALGLAVASVGVRSVYSQMVANADVGSFADLARIADAAPAPAIDVIGAVAVSTIGTVAIKPPVVPQTDGFAPIGVTARITVPDSFTAAESRPIVGVSAQASAATPEMTPIDRPATDPDQGKLGEKSRVTKKKRARAPAVQEWPDGRQVRGPFDPWSGFASAPRQGRRVQMARPGPFEAPF